MKYPAFYLATVQASVDGWRARCLVAACLSYAATAWPAASASAADAAPHRPNAVIHLRNGDVAAGQLLDSGETTHLLWTSQAFADPLRFRIRAVQAIHFPSPTKLTQPEGDYCIELAGGDLLYGSLESLDDQRVLIDVANLGHLQVERAIVRRMVRRAKSELIYLGPSGLDGWHTGGSVKPARAEGGRVMGNAKPWREEAGHLIADQEGATLRRDFQAPALARFEIDLSWTKKPDFELALGSGLDAKSALRAFHIEVWGNQLVAARETEREADVAALQELGNGPGRISLRVFLDQKQGRMLVYSSGGVPLADLNVSALKPQYYGGLQIVNKRGDLRLESLRIGRWEGELPRASEANRARLVKSDGAVVYGKLMSYDASQHAFVVDVEKTELRIDETQVEDVFFAPPRDEVPRSLRVTFFSGVRVSGNLLKVEQGSLWLECPGIDEPLKLSMDAVQSLTTLEPQGDSPTPNGSEGRLEFEGTSLRGNLADAEETDASCLSWRPALGDSEARLARGVSARIIYREPAPEKPATTAPKPAPARRAAILQLPILNLIAKNNSNQIASVPARAKQTRPVLHLRSGDTIACDVKGINENGIEFATALTETKFVKHDQVKVLELMPEAAAVKIAKSKKERLLTLPRMQRDSPPTQLIRSVDGDYLRGRLVALDEKELQVEVRLETKTIPRSSVARIIWLHPDELEGSSPPSSPDAPRGTRVQAIPSDGNRLTFFADRVEGKVLLGRSDLLGSCRVDLGTIDQLLIGTSIEQGIAKLAFHQWKLKPAPDPLAANEDSSGGDDSEGLESALVGKPAPDFELDLLDGKKFRLTEHKRKILVLDFWASWCGPCLQVMPQVDRVAREFVGDDVQLVAVNLEETPERVKAALERLQLDMTVALDRQGRVAEKYGANSIPQTVVVDRDGKVARLFVGGGARFDEQLRGALKSLIALPTNPAPIKVE